MNSTITTQTVKTLNFQAFREKKRQKVGFIHPHHMWNIPTAYKRREKCGDYDKHEYKNHLGRMVTYMHGGWKVSDRIYLCRTRSDF